MATELKPKKCSNYVLKELFGALKLKRPTEQILKEIRQDLGGKCLK